MENHFTKSNNNVKIEIIDRKPLSQGAFGAFEYGSVLEYRVTFPRRDGVAFPRLFFRNDDSGEEFEVPMYFYGMDGINEIYTCIVDTSEICDADGLLYYLIRYSAFDDNYEIGRNLEKRRDNAVFFQLMIYANGFKTPEWFGRGMVYQIFPDRFCKIGEVKLKDDSVFNDDWYGGIPQHAKNRGEAVLNNEFFGGNLAGIIEKLPYLSSLGVCSIYLNPIFEAYSNHRYDTGDYMKIDETLGSDEDFKKLADAALKHGIRIILDGVFNHTGDNSRYFDKYSKYGTGAYSNPQSEYLNWYTFRSYPDDYECWWNIPILPRVRCDEESFANFICGQNGVIRHWLKQGASGWRLDVADELSDNFIERLRSSAQIEKKDVLIIGEVWENASDKISYGKRRRYLRGKELDSVMNYPVRDAIIAYLKSADTSVIARTIENICDNYPRCVRDRLMNFLGTHDTIRILNVLSCDIPQNKNNDELANLYLSESEKEKGMSLLKLGYILIFTLPGVPCVYYGDEAGMQGWNDPFNRLPYPWGHENGLLIEFVKRLGSIRKDNIILSDGNYRQLYADHGVFGYEREYNGERICVYINLSCHDIKLNGNCQSLISNSKTAVISPYNGDILEGKAYIIPMD